MISFLSTPSPSFNDRDPAVPLRYVVLHYTGMKTGTEALARLCDPAAQVSAHYLIEEDGRVFRLVAEAKRAWHAGQSFWRGVTDMNSASLGIELVNPGHAFGYRPFPAAQIAALKVLLKDVVARHGLDPRTALLAHSDIAPERKDDPGEFFPWQELAQEGLGVWPNMPFVKPSLLPEDEVRACLDKMGYADTPKALLAFQRRFVPEELTGTPTPLTCARLNALANA